MTAEFNVWLLVVGLVVGAGLVWLVIMDSRRRESEVDEAERPREAAWLSSVMAEDGYDITPEAAERLLLLHRAYLQASPPDGVMDDGEADELGAGTILGGSAIPADGSEGTPTEPQAVARPPSPAQSPADAPDGLRRPG